MAHYKQPRRINPISILLLALVVGAIYAGMKFGPPYWRDREVSSVLQNAVNQFYRDRDVTGAEQAIREDVTHRMRTMGIDDPNLVIRFERTPEILRITATYEVIVSHPGRKITRLRFSPSAETGTKSAFD